MKKKYWGLLLLCAALCAGSPAGRAAADGANSAAKGTNTAAQGANASAQDTGSAADTADSAEKADDAPDTASGEWDTTLPDTGDFVKSPLPDPVFSAEAGFYEDELLLSLSVPKGYRVCYTLDGSLPQPGSAGTLFYEEPLLLTDARNASKKVMRAVVVRAVTVADDDSLGDCVTNTYFIGSGVTTAYTVPVVSLVTDRSNLYDEDTGIFIHYEESGRQWERPFHFEYFEGGEQVISLNCGGRVHGGASRGIDMKSIRLYARAEYDTQKNFKYDFFSGGTVPALDVNGQPIRKFKHLLLRGGGNEATAWERTYFRDSLTAWLMKDTGLDVQASQPAVVFLNGEYYGIMNLRERQDERYIEEHYGLANELVAIYSFWYDQNGDIRIEADADTDELARLARTHYQEAFQFATTADLRVPENYEKVCSYFDIDNYIDYLCVEIYCGNTDWPGNNCKAWSYFGEDTGTPGSDGKIRWLLYDTEFGYGLYGHHVSEDTLAAALAWDSKEWPNPKGSTLLFRSLLKNDDFYDAFLSRMLDLINENFRADAAQKAANTMAVRYIPLIQENRAAGNYFDRYDNNITVVNDYLRLRPKAMRALLGRRFVLGPLYDLSVSFDASLGSLKVNTITASSGANSVDGNGFSGTYACALPVTVTAIPAEGCRFAGFSGDLFSEVQTNPDGTATVVVTNPDEAKAIALTALFVKSDDTEPTVAPDANGNSSGSTGQDGSESQGSSGSRGDAPDQDGTGDQNSAEGQGSSENQSGAPGQNGTGGQPASGTSLPPQNENTGSTPDGSGAPGSSDEASPDTASGRSAERILLAVLLPLTAVLIAALLLQSRRNRHGKQNEDKKAGQDREQA
ncbi:MAG: CotH kinase family protein [Lachnospiraceae bacterium]|nr:CotH kinase family protein [Lachnospiraceae bacterium]